MFLFLLQSLKRLTTVQLQLRRILVVGVQGGGDLLRGWLDSDAVTLVEVELQQILRGVGELTHRVRAVVLVVEVDVFFKVLRPLQDFLTKSTYAVVIIGSIFTF